MSPADEKRTRGATAGRVGLVAEQNLVPGSDRFEADRSSRGPGARAAPHITLCLRLVAREGLAFLLRLDHTAQSTADEQRIIHRAGGGGKLAHGDTGARAEVHSLAPRQRASRPWPTARRWSPARGLRGEKLLPRDGTRSDLPAPVQVHSPHSHNSNKRGSRRVVRAKVVTRAYGFLATILR